MATKLLCGPAFTLLPIRFILPTKLDCTILLGSDIVVVLEEVGALKLVTKLGNCCIGSRVFNKGPLVACPVEVTNILGVILEGKEVVGNV